MVELLLDAGADVHVVVSGTQANGGWGPSTPLQLAAASNPESAVVAALLAAGGGPERQRCTDQRLDAPAPGGLAKPKPVGHPGPWSPQAQTSAREPGPGRLRFTRAARNNPEVVPLLLELGADLYAADDEGTTALTLIRRKQGVAGVGGGWCGAGGAAGFFFLGVIRCAAAGPSVETLLSMVETLLYRVVWLARMHGELRYPADPDHGKKPTCSTIRS